MGCLRMFKPPPHTLCMLFLLFHSFLFAACGGTGGRGAGTQEEGDSAPAIGTVAEPDTAQLAEYVVEVFQDSKGHLWFGTVDHGAARYDGETLTYFTEKDGLCGNTVTSFAEDTLGNLWFGTHSGACKYDGVGFTAYRNTEARVNAAADGGIWVGSGTSVARFNGNFLVDLPLPMDVPAITTYSITPGRVSLKLQDSRGDLWFGTDGAGAYRYDGHTFTQFTKKDGLCSNTVNDIVEDGQGRLWFICMQAYQPKMTGDGGLCRYDPSAAPGAKAFTQFPEVEGLHGNDLYSILADRAGNVWMGATGLGVYRYSGGRFTLFNDIERRDLAYNIGVQDIFEDRTGKLWFGFSGGLYRLDGTTLVNVTRGGPWK